MGKLNIAHHKSYHPYRQDNIERVRRDEENARREEEAREQRIMVADAEARIEVLRRKAGVAFTGEGDVPSSSSSSIVSNALEPASAPVPGPSSLVAPTSGHVNLFEDLEKQDLAVMLKTTSNKRNPKEVEAEKGIPLAPSEKDRTPWYSVREGERGRAIEGEGDKEREKMKQKGLRDLARKSRHDPLTHISRELAQRDSSSTSTTPSRRPMRPPAVPSGRPEVAERLSRESSERQRALELIRKRKMAERGSATPSTVYGGRDEEEGYGDQYNRREVEAAHMYRGRERRDDRDERFGRRDDRRGGGWRR